nr:putative transposase En/Spm [Ipomoea batatas]
MQGRKSEARGKGIALPQSEDLILQPPSVAIFEEDHMQIRMIPTPPNLVRRELHDTDSERTISTADIPRAVKTFKTAPQHLKDVWFNEFKKRHEWDPNDEGTVRLIFEKKATRLLADALCEEAVTNLKQTQLQVTESAMWLEATGGVRKGGYVSGFGSDTAHFFPEARIHRKSNIGSSTSHSSCEARIKQLEEQNQVMQQQQQDMHEENRRIRDIIQKMEATLAQFSANLGSLDQDPNKNSSNDDTLPPSTSDDDTLAPSTQD